VGYTLTALPIFYVHHYWSSNMPGVLVLAYALPPLAVPLVAWGWAHWMRHRRADPQRRAQAVLAPGLGAATE